MTARIEYRPLGEIRRWPRNPKLHDLGKIEASIERHGFVAPAVQDETTGQLVAGHGRLEALERMKAAGKAPPRRIQVKKGEWLMPVLMGVSFASEEQAEEYLLADNRLAEVGGWLPKLLAPFLEQRSEETLAQLGWTPADLDRFKADIAALEGQAGAAADLDPSGIRQIVMRFAAKDFDAMMERLERIFRRMKASDHTEVFLGLLSFYEAHRC